MCPELYIAITNLVYIHPNTYPMKNKLLVEFKKEIDKEI